ncbi:TIGR02186 family protein [Boseongicola aestuarii]|uniref:Putative transmembrane protein (Alph_Pro_TM) n=1 Tax=Boseongicola aestuarii TaxID=1470561 RepID=A0A238IXK7_9RHOB|nr:TIGR02186 family protein [Boseongicola aestuarii]SMX22781.1 Putative transmembrane protein (Alph_Pro_TM) [Boseongicola aestuarii]
MIRLLCFLIAFALPAQAEEVVAGLSQDSVQITTNFEGSEILIFGAVKRAVPLPGGPPLQVIVTVEGPAAPITIRRKDKRFGIWVNNAAVEVDAAPSFYAVATSAPWADVILDVEDLRHSVSIDRAIRAVGLDREDRGSFIEALLRIKESQDAYLNAFGSVEVSEETLFKTSIQLPANLTEGDYKARFFLTRGGAVLDVHETNINVSKVGLERFLFNLSRQQPLVYGLMSLAIAIFAGWAASAFFRYFRF